MTGPSDLQIAQQRYRQALGMLAANRTTLSAFCIAYEVEFPKDVFTNLEYAIKANWTETRKHILAKRTKSNG